MTLGVRGRNSRRQVSARVVKVLPRRVRVWAHIGVNAILLSGATAGRQSICGPSSVVVKDVPEFPTTADVPGRASSDGGRTSFAVDRAALLRADRVSGFVV
jgi:serine acetyltransferase